MKGLRRIIIASNREHVYGKIHRAAAIMTNGPIILQNGENFLEAALTLPGVRMVFYDYLLPNPLMPPHNFGFEMRENTIFSNISDVPLIGIKKHNWMEMPYFTDFLNEDFRAKEVYALMQKYMPRTGPIKQ